MAHTCDIFNLKDAQHFQCSNPVWDVNGRCSNINKIPVSSNIILYDPVECEYVTVLLVGMCEIVNVL